MKTKAQKQEELKKGKGLWQKSKALLFVDFGKVGTKDMRNLRQELKNSGNPLFVMKKRLLNLIFKEQGMAWNDREHKTSVGTVFASDFEKAAGAVYRFFAGLEKEKKIEGTKILGGYDLGAKTPMDAAQVVFVGKLPTREVLLAQLAAMIAAPVRSLLYIMKVKSERS